MPRHNHYRWSHLILLSLTGLSATFAPGCGDYYKHFREEANTGAQARLAEIEARHQITAPAEYRQPADTLRRRLLLTHQLPHSGPTSLGADQLAQPEHWPEPDLYKNPNTQPATQPGMTITQDQTLVLTLDQALWAGARNNRQYQRLKEEVFLAALDIELAEDSFRTTYAGLISSLFNINSTGGSTLHRNLSSTEASATKTLKNGATLAARIGLDVVNLLSQDTNDSMGMFAELSWTLPLLSGAGWHVITEPLTQAERNTLYAIMNLDRYKRTYAVNVTSDYLRVLQNQQRVKNALDNYQRLKQQAERSRQLAEAGRLPSIEVGQAEQQELSAKNNYLSAKQNAENALDEFKILLGLPTDANIELDPDTLDQLNTLAEEYFGKLEGKVTYNKPGQGPKLNNADTQPAVNLADVDESAPPGPLELDPDHAIRIALLHRRDVQIAMGRVYDAQRDVIVAGDGLLPTLDISGDVSWGGNKGISSAGTANANIRLNKLNFNTRVQLDFPWEKTSESVAYRETLISLDRQLRNVQELEDEIKQDVRATLRTLDLSRRSYLIQRRALQIAEERVDSTRLFLEAGQAQIRDALDAEADLLSAQNSLTGAMVNYRIAEMNLLRDLGLMKMNPDGGWIQMPIPEEEALHQMSKTQDWRLPVDRPSPDDQKGATPTP